MKAILNTKFGPPELLQLGEVEKPIPKDNEVLIRVYATTVSTGDCNARDFTFAPKSFQFPARLFVFGITKPRIKILGTELAGVIEEVGKDVTLFKEGDQVFGTSGMTMATHAEYTCKPSSLCALNSLERKNDWGSIYPGKITVGVTMKDN